MELIPDKDIANFLSPDIIWKYKIIPFKVEGNALTVMIAAGEHAGLAGELELVTGYEIAFVQEEAERINHLLNRFYRKDANMANAKTISAETQNVDDFLLKIIREAKNLQSSDIHIEAYSEKCRIRFRIDGKLIERYRIPKEHYPSFINKVKIKSRLDIAEKRLPQDGRILISEGTEKIDIRVSVLPSLHGEKVVLRLLNNDASHISLDRVGLDEKQLSDFNRTLQKPHGIILISGPTGSGKTTTLYATLKTLNNEHSNILTIEDPIEYTLDGINQVQLKENIGLTFSSALRTFLRQDPDIIMLGEIRDGETAEMAIRAALTGHLVLSTIHTNSAWGTISRLVDMGVAPFLLSATINMTIAQRLVRKLCVKCKLEMKIETADVYADIKQLFEPGTIHYAADGCDDCYHTGYAGRIAIYEVVPIDAELSSLIKENIQDVSLQLKKRKINSLKERVLELIKGGITSIEEAYPILLNQ